MPKRKKQIRSSSVVSAFGIKGVCWLIVFDHKSKTFFVINDAVIPIGNILGLFRDVGIDVGEPVSVYTQDKNTLAYKIASLFGPQSLYVKAHFADENKSGKHNARLIEKLRLCEELYSELQNYRKSFSKNGLEPKLENFSLLSEFLEKNSKLLDTSSYIKSVIECQGLLVGLNEHFGIEAGKDSRSDFVSIT